MKLVDGIITDDADVFLFGGDQVYRNVFNQTESVTKFSMDRISNILQLNQTRMIQLAYFTGSDYSEGIKGVGVVNAFEIISVLIALFNFNFHAGISR